MSDEDRTRIVSNSGAMPAALRGGDSSSTKVVGGGATPQADDETPKTRVFMASRDEKTEAPEASGAFEPVVAWVVVTSGPGRGNSRAMRYGMNSVGRDSSERVALDFGDEAISREAHAYLVYDDQQQDYYIQHGGKSNLVRVNSKPVLAPVELVHGDRIEIGNTELMFVPLCSDTFNWNEPSA